MKKIFIKNFKVDGDLFYTEAVRMYCLNLGVESVSSLEEINTLEEKITECMLTDSGSLISSKIKKEKLASAYFTALRMALKN